MQCKLWLFVKQTYISNILWYGLSSERTWCWRKTPCGFLPIPLSCIRVPDYRFDSICQIITTWILTKSYQVFNIIVDKVFDGMPHRNPVSFVEVWMNTPNLFPHLWILMSWLLLKRFVPSDYFNHQIFQRLPDLLIILYSFFYFLCARPDSMECDHVYSHVELAWH